MCNPRPALVAGPTSRIGGRPASARALTTRRTPVPSYRDVMIGFENGDVTCNPWNATVYYDHAEGPSSVRWIVEKAPTGATGMRINWENGSPFVNFGVEASSESGGTEAFAILVGSGLAREEAVFKYSILFLDADGKVIAGVDPAIVDSPRP